jgi:hypothetical protein
MIDYSAWLAIELERRKLDPPPPPTPRVVPPKTDASNPFDPRYHKEIVYGNGCC